MSGYEVMLPATGTRDELAGDLIVPENAQGIVLFAHGSGSSRLSSRNRWVAEQLQAAGIATLLMDLLTSEEEQLDVATGRLRFDIALLTRRVLGAADWLLEDERTKDLAVGLFGASTGAAAALGAVAQRPGIARAIVSRGGRPDMAEGLAVVETPTLLLVGGRDDLVIELNKQAARELGLGAELRVVEGATHLFEEPGALEQVATEAAEWFRRHLSD